MRWASSPGPGRPLASGCAGLAAAMTTLLLSVTWLRGNGAAGDRPDAGACGRAAIGSHGAGRAAGGVDATGGEGSASGMGCVSWFVARGAPPLAARRQHGQGYL